MSIFKNPQPEAKRSLADCHALISADRDTGNGIYLTARRYPTGDVEMCGIRLESEDTLRRGGGAKRKNTDKTQMDVFTLHKSVQRARVNIRRKVLTIQADNLLTLTFRENVTDINDAWKCFHYFVKQMRWRYKDRWRYVAVPEYQDRGAVHFHLAIAGYYHHSTVRRIWLAAVGQKGGNIDFSSAKRRYGSNTKNPKKIAGYIAKYISKHDSSEFNRRRFSSGGKIQIPSPLTGWLALGCPVIAVMRQTIEVITRKQVVSVWESENYYGIVYLST